MNLETHRDVIDEHEGWLGPSRLGKWRRHLSDRPSTAVVEAYTRRLLQRYVTVEPNDLASGGPDFFCKSAGGRFYVECTAVEEAKTARVTGLTADWDSGPKFLRPLCSAINDKVTDRSKIKQLRSVNDSTVLAVGIMSFGAIPAIREIHLEWLLTGRLNKAGIVEPNADPYERHGDFAFACRTGEGGWRAERKYVSAILVSGFGAVDPRPAGVLHPEPEHPFEPSWLPGIRFCSYANWPQTVDDVAWAPGQADAQ